MSYTLTPYHFSFNCKVDKLRIITVVSKGKTVYLPYFRVDELVSIDLVTLNLVVDNFENISDATDQLRKITENSYLQGIDYPLPLSCHGLDYHLTLYFEIYNLNENVENFVTY